MRRVFVAAALLTFVLTAPQLASAQVGENVTVTISPTTSAVVLGGDFDLQVTVTNNATVATQPLAIHLDITDPEQKASVDPEDWTSTLTKQIGVVGPGETVTVDWNLQPIAPGTFTAYAIALAPGSDSVAVTNTLTVTVEDQRSLNPGGILAVSIAAPLAVGSLLGVQQISARRVRSSGSSKAHRGTLGLSHGPQSNSEDVGN